MTEAQIIARHARLISEATLVLVKEELSACICTPADALRFIIERVECEVKEMRKLLPKAETLRRKVALERSIRSLEQELNHAACNIFTLHDAITDRLKS